MRGLNSSAVIAVVLTVFGCATQESVRNLYDVPIVDAAKRSTTMTKVAAAIKEAGRSLGWQMYADAPGVFTGRLAIRNHVAVVEINHDAQGYSIQYRDSVNLDARDGLIHKAYNQWVGSLDNAIRSQLQRL